MRTRPNKNTMSIKIRNPFNILLFLFQTLLLLKKRRKNLVKSQKLVLGWQQNVYLYFVHASLRPIFLPIGVLWTQCANLRNLQLHRFYVKTKVGDLLKLKSRDSKTQNFKHCPLYRFKGSGF